MLADTSGGHRRIINILALFFIFLFIVHLIGGGFVVSIADKAKEGKVVLITSKSNAAKIVPKNPQDASKIEVVTVD
jgi:hypothetical protein